MFKCKLHQETKCSVIERVDALTPIHETAALLSHINTTEDLERKLCRI